MYEDSGDHADMKEQAHHKSLQAAICWDVTFQPLSNCI